MENPKISRFPSFFNILQLFKNLKEFTDLETTPKHPLPYFFTFSFFLFTFLIAPLFLLTGAALIALEIPDEEEPYFVFAAFVPMLLFLIIFYIKMKLYVRKLEKRFKSMTDFIDLLNKNRLNAHGIHVILGDCGAWLEIRFLNRSCKARYGLKLVNRLHEKGRRVLSQWR